MTSRLQRYSRYLLYFILLVLPLERIPSYQLAHPVSATIRLSQVAGLILIVINLPRLWQNRRRVWRTPWLFLALYLFIALVSAGLSAHHLRSASVWAFTAFDMVLAWTISLVFERERLHSYLKWLLIGAAVTALFGFYQFFGDLAGLPTSLTGLRAMYTKAVFGFPRIQSTGLEPLYYSDYLLIPAGLLMTWWLTARRRAALWLMLPVFTVIWMGLSRAAIVALAGELVLALGYGWYLRRGKAALGLLAMGLITLGLAVGLVSMASHFNTTPKGQHAVQNFAHQATNVSQGGSARDRAVTRQLAVQAFKQHPVVGLGPGNFGYYATGYHPRSFSSKTIVNNEPLEILAETGALGALAILGFVLSLLQLIWRRWQQLGSTRWFAGGLILALIAIAAQYQTFSTLYITHVWVAAGLLMGALLTKHHEMA